MTLFSQTLRDPESLRSADPFEGIGAISVVGTGNKVSVNDTFLNGSVNGTLESLVAFELTADSTYEFTSDSQILDNPSTTTNRSNGLNVAVDDNAAGTNTALTNMTTPTGSSVNETDALSPQNDLYEVAATAAGVAGALGSVGSVEEMALFLTNGYWGGQDYSFDTSASNVITINIAGLTTAGQQLAQWATQAWETVANLSFEIVTSSEMITMDDEYEGAYAFTPNAGQVSGGVEINISTDWLMSEGTDINSHSFQTYVHEFGHALGLGHQGDYDGGASYDLGEGVVFTNDSYQMSVMSYFNQFENTSVDATYAVALGPMMVDIYAIQEKYGAPGSGSATAGNTVSGLGSNLGTYMDDVFAWIADDMPPSDILDENGNMAFTVYDRDGIDTLDFSMFDINVRLDLNDGQFSDFGNNIGVMGIAVGTVLENAKLGTGNDVAILNDAANSIVTGGGNDTVFGVSGGDKIDGGAGRDTIHLDIRLSEVTSGGYSGNLLTMVGAFGTATVRDVETFVFKDQSLSHTEMVDYFNAGQIQGETIIGTSGHDLSLMGTEGNDFIKGRAGSDIIAGLGGDDTILGGIGADDISGGAGSDTLWAEDGFDILKGEAGNDLLYGNNGNDTLFGGDGADFLNGGLGADDLFGGNDNDKIIGMAGFDTLHGGNGNDQILGMAGFDTLYGGKGNDTLSGNNGNDKIYGDGGNDLMAGGLGHDKMYGGNGADTLHGESGFDLLKGGAGNDSISGGAGHDTLYGEAGNDVLNGGAGADTFVFSASDDHDVIEDFTNGIDTLLLDASLLNTTPANFDVNDYATVINGILTLNFDLDTSITFINGISVDQLENNIEF